MITVKLSTSTNMPLIRQTPKFSGIFDNIRFMENEGVENCDYWVVYDDLRSAEEVMCPQKNTILITGEPPCIKTYDRSFLNQFSVIITSHRKLIHHNKIYYQPGLPWHVGRKIINPEVSEYPLNFDELSSIDHFDKPNLISAVVSSKTKTRDQKQRIKFVEQFKKRSSFDLDTFGTGRNLIDDKWNAVAPYKYHLVLENCAVPDYFTEKLSDSYLGGAYPFYYGCPNINRYFPENSYTQIDIYNIDESIEIIEKKIAENVYEQSIDAIMKARNLILWKYNFFALISFIINQDSTTAGQPKGRIIIHPQISCEEKHLPGKIKGLLRSFRKNFNRFF
jgi:hypothetical protein